MTYEAVLTTITEYMNRPYGVWTFDPEELARKIVPKAKHKEEYLQRVDDHANAEWKERAFQVVKELCRTRPTFTGDDVWSELEKHEEKSHEPRALGVILLRAASENLCEITTEHVKSVRPERHKAPIAVWRSHIYSPQLV